MKRILNLVNLNHQFDLNLDTKMCTVAPRGYLSFGGNAPATERLSRASAGGPGAAAPGCNEVYNFKTIQGNRK